MTVTPPGQSPSAKRPSPQREQAFNLTTIRFRQHSIRVKGFKARPGSELKHYELALQKYLQNSKPRNIPEVIEIRQEEQGVLRGDVWESTIDRPVRNLIIPQRYLDVWMIFYQLLSARSAKSLTQRAFQKILASQGLGIKKDELQHILKHHPDISIGGGSISIVKRKANTEETIMQAIEDHGRSFAAERAARLLLKTSAEREVSPEEVKPGLHVRDISDLTHIPRPTISKVIKNTHPRFVAIGSGVRSPYHHWVTDPAVIDLIPRPSENPGNPKEKFHWSYACLWLTLSREEYLYKLQTPTEIHRAMVDVGFLYDIRAVFALFKNDKFHRFFAGNVNSEQKTYRLSAGHFNYWQSALLRLDITKPFPDSKMTLPVEYIL
jgi:hypothetical protein